MKEETILPTRNENSISNSNGVGECSSKQLMKLSNWDQNPSNFCNIH